LKTIEEGVWKKSFSTPRPNSEGKRDQESPCSRTEESLRVALGEQDLAIINGKIIECPKMFLHECKQPDWENGRVQIQNIKK